MKLFFMARFSRWLIDALQRRDYPVVQGSIAHCHYDHFVNLLVDAYMALLTTYPS